MKKLTLLLSILLLVACNTTHKTVNTTIQEEKEQRVVYLYSIYYKGGVERGGTISILRKDRTDKNIMNIIHNEVLKTVDNKEEIQEISILPQ